MLSIIIVERAHCLTFKLAARHVPVAQLLDRESLILNVLYRTGAAGKPKIA